MQLIGDETEWKALINVVSLVAMKRNIDITRKDSHILSESCVKLHIKALQSQNEKWELESSFENAVTSIKSLEARIRKSVSFKMHFVVKSVFQS